MKELDAKIVRELLDCDSKTGLLTWRERDVKWFKDGKQSAQHSCNNWNSKNAGKRASRFHKSSGYFSVRIFDKKYKAHRIIWLWHYGEWPEHHIDHLDGDRANNCIDNLADKTHSENHKNRKKNSRNTSGYPGVGYNKKVGKWEIHFYVNGRLANFGPFSTAEEAFDHYVKMAREAGYTERHIFGDSF